MQTTTVDPVLITLASAMRLQFAQEPAAVRAIDRAVEHLAAGVAYDFDGVELRIVSRSRGDAVWHVTDGAGYCSCEAGKYRPWCLHRAAFRLLMAKAALTEPHLLRARIVEQTEPADAGDWPPDSILGDGYFAALPEI